MTTARAAAADPPEERVLPDEKPKRGGPRGKPPYRLVADGLREKILSGGYPTGKVPSERALMRRWDVSRATAAKALDILEGEGLVVRRRGAGAFVNPGAVAAPGQTFVATLIADMAIEFMPAWERLSRRRVRYVGIDDISHCRSLGISSMRQPSRFIGEEAVRLMALRLRHDAIPARQVLFSAELVARNSSV